MLSELGYNVLRAKDADNALVIIESGAAIFIAVPRTAEIGASRPLPCVPAKFALADQ